MAKSYEDDGLYEKAVPIYEDLYKKDPSNIVILDKLKNGYRALGRYESLIQVLSETLKTDSLNAVLLSELADAHFRARRIPEAQGIVTKIVRLDPFSETTYRLTASVLMSNRRFDELEKLYILGRQNLRNEKLFLQEMANLLGYRGKYYEATKEFLKLYRLDPSNLNYIKTQILQFPDNDSDNRAVIKGVREDLILNSSDLLLSKFLIDLLYRNEEYEAAFEQSKWLDERKGKTGAEILSFANLTFENRQYALSQKAYEYFLILYPQTPQAEIGIAKCLEGLGSSAGQVKMATDTSSQNQKISETFYSDKAIAAYQEIINKYPGTEWSAEAYFHIGEIRLNKFFDVQEALTDFKRVADAKNPYRIEAMFRIGECYLIEGDLEKPLEQYASVRKETRDPVLRERADFRGAEIYFYLQQFDSCRTQMERISKGRNGLFVNDALSYLLLLQENQKEPEQIKRYARADLLYRQKKYSEALAVLDEMIRSNPSSSITDDALFKTGEIRAASGQYLNAISVFRNIVDHMPNSPLGDVALKRIGDILYDPLGQAGESAKAYKELLIRFPKSIYTNPVRKRLREIEQPAKKTS